MRPDRGSYKIFSGSHAFHLIWSWDVAITTSAGLAERVKSKQDEMQPCHVMLQRSNPQATVESVPAILTLDGIISKSCTAALRKLGAGCCEMAVITDWGQRGWILAALNA
jgi:hypothetical protein